MEVGANSSTQAGAHCFVSSSRAKKQSIHHLEISKESFADLEGTKDHHQSTLSMFRHESVLPGLTYCLVSTSMVLLNKSVLSSFGFNAPIAMLSIQCTFCALFAFLSQAAGLTRLEPPSARLISAMIPINVLFVGMIATSFLALQDLGIAMVTVLKNTTNLFIICGDYFLFGKVYNRYVWCTLALMIVSAICGSVTDLAFSARGYSWQLINCAMTASYSLSLRLLMERYVSCAQGGKKPLNEMSMVFYNNLLSIPLLVPLALSRGELAAETLNGISHNPRFVLAASLSVLCAFAISFSSLWFLSTTSATTYSLVGSINKVPLACIAVVLSRAPVTLDNGLSISIGLAASILFVWAKQKH